MRRNGGGRSTPAQQGPVPDGRGRVTAAEKKPSKQPKKKPLNVRKDFPETWLWTEEMVK